MKTDRRKTAPYLWQRPNTDVFWFSRAVPKRLWENEGRKVIQFSLGTTDRAQAKAMAIREATKLDEKWGVLAGRTDMVVSSALIPREPDLEEAAVVIAHDFVRSAADEGRKTLRGKGSNMWKSHVRYVQAELADQAYRTATSDDAGVRDLADEAIAALGFDLEPGSEGYAKFCDYLNQAKLAALHVNNLRNLGDIEAEADSRLVERVRQRESDRAKPGESIAEQYDEYARWRSDPSRKRHRRPETMEQDRVAIDLFAEFVGHDRAVISITKDEARAFRQMLAKFPASRAKNAKLAKASIDACIAAAQRDGLKTLSLTTQAKYMSILSPFFGWLVSDASVNIPLNIFDGLHHKLASGANRRPSFSADQLNGLLGSRLFEKSGGTGREHKRGDVEVRDWRYWIPLLCLFTGSRITEVAQLHVDDIAIKEGAPLVLLTHDESDGQFIKNKKGRLAALHPILVSAGFIKYWTEQRERSEEDGNKQLFPELKGGKRSLLGDAPARWFRRYLERIEIKDGSDGIGAHSFRHTMANAMRAAGYMDIEYGQLVLGHSNNFQSSVYGSTPQGTPSRLISMLDAAFKAAPFKDVDFTPLTNADKNT